MPNITVLCKSFVENLHRLLHYYLHRLLHYYLHRLLITAHNAEKMYTSLLISPNIWNIEEKSQIRTSIRIWPFPEKYGTNAMIRLQVICQ